MTGGKQSQLLVLGLRLEFDNIQYTNLNNIQQNFQDLFGKLFRNIYVLMIMIIMDFIDISCLASHYRQFLNIRTGFINDYMNFKETS